MKEKIIHTLNINTLSKVNIYYLLGKKCTRTMFYPVLVPRNETEIITNLTNYIIRKKNIVIDLCSGSGLILYNMNKTFNTKILIDSNYLCILSGLTHKNISLYSELNFFLKTKKKINILTSNPPYLCIKHVNFYSLIKKIISLHSKFKGIAFLLKIINLTYYTLKNNGILVLEHSYNQAKIVRKLMSNKGFSNIKTLNDLNTLSRITFGQK